MNSEVLCKGFSSARCFCSCHVFSPVLRSHPNPSHPIHPQHPTYPINNMLRSRTLQHRTAAKVSGSAADRVQVTRHEVQGPPPLNRKHQKRCDTTSNSHVNTMSMDISGTLISYIMQQAKNLNEVYVPSRFPQMSLLSWLWRVVSVSSCQSSHLPASKVGSLRLIIYYLVLLLGITCTFLCVGMFRLGGLRLRRLVCYLYTYDVCTFCYQVGKVGMHTCMSVFSSTPWLDHRGRFVEGASR
jgi:hypothetical protein